MDDVDPRVLAGTLVGDRYKIVELLKRGAFALSFRATDQQDGRAVYLRLFFCPPDALEEVERALAAQFVRSAQVMSELSRGETAIVKTQLGRHPHALPNGVKVPWAVYEWVQGSTLAELQTRPQEERPGPSTLSATLERFDGVIDLLMRAHDRGIVHRRLDPAQIWVLDTRGAGTPLKVDGFGGRAPPGEGPRVPATVPREPPSPHHAAPEQQSGHTDREGAWSDVYSLAMLLLDDMLGQTTAWEEWDRRQRVGSDEPTASGVLPTPRRLGIELGGEEDRVFACALQPDPELRFRSMREFRDAMRQATDGGPITWTKQAFAARTKAVGSFDNPTPRPAENAEPLPAPITLQISEQSRDGDESSSGAHVSVERTPPPTAASTRPADAPNGTQRVAEPRSSTSAATSARPGRAKPGLRRAHVGLALGGVAVAIVLITVAGRSGPAKSIDQAAAGSKSAEPDAPTPSPKPPAATPKPPPPPPLRCPPEMVAVDTTTQRANAAQLGSYCLQRHEVSVSQYQACAMTGACSPPRHESSWPQGSELDRAANSELCNWRYADRATHPVNCVDWHQARAYCSFRRWRLPTNAEWAFAARGPEGRSYPWGEDPPSEQRVNACGLECRAWRADRKLADTEILYEADDRFPGSAPVGSFKAGATPSGIEDLAGNVFEWVEDIDPVDRELRTIRGGGFDQIWPEALLSEVAVRQPSSAYAHSLGFRCAMSLR